MELAIFLAVYSSFDKTIRNSGEILSELSKKKKIENKESLKVKQLPLGKKFPVTVSVGLGVGGPHVYWMILCSFAWLELES